MRAIWERLVLLLAALRHQLIHWPRYTSRHAKLAVAAFCFVAVGAVGTVFNGLPVGWPDIVLGNLDHLPGLFVAFVLSATGTIGFVYYVVLHRVLHEL